MLNDREFKGPSGEETERSRRFYEMRDLATRTIYCCQYEFVLSYTTCFFNHNQGAQNRIHREENGQDKYKFVTDSPIVTMTKVARRHRNNKVFRFAIILPTQKQTSNLYFRGL
jgi:hypothetical protein